MVERKKRYFYIGNGGANKQVFVDWLKAQFAEAGTCRVDVRVYQLYEVVYEDKFAAQVEGLLNHLAAVEVSEEQVLRLEARAERNDRNAHVNISPFGLMSR